MTDYNKEIETFKQFAAEKLKIEQDELQTRYANEQIDKETLQQAYTEHRKILMQELKEKSENLLAGNDNPSLKEELNKLSETYIQQLSPSN